MGIQSSVNKAVPKQRVTYCLMTHSMEVDERLS